MASFSADQLLKSLQVVINNLLASTQPHDDNGNPTEKKLKKKKKMSACCASSLIASAEVFSRELCFLIERFMNDGLRRKLL